jgi:hypothetical protein
MLVFPNINSSNPFKALPKTVNCKMFLIVVTNLGELLRRLPRSSIMRNSRSAICNSSSNNNNNSRIQIIRTASSILKTNQQNRLFFRGPLHQVSPLFARLIKGKLSNKIKVSTLK